MNAGSMAAAAAAVESGDMGVLAMKHKDYQQALFYLNLGIQQAPTDHANDSCQTLKTQSRLLLGNGEEERCLPGHEECN